MKKEIYEILKNYFGNKTEYFDKIEIFKSNNYENGDYSTNIALKVSHDFKKYPVEFAKEMKIYLEKNYKDYFDEVKITNPGFLNFKLNKNFIGKKLLTYLDKNYESNFDIEKKYINYEFVSANPTGNLHIGHARNAIVGDIVINIFNYLGQNVVREYYINDAGNQVENLANSIYYYYQILKNEKSDLSEESVTYHGLEIQDYAKELLEESTTYDYEYIKNNSKEHFLSEISKTLTNLGLKPFDVFTSEQKLFDDKKVDNFIATISKTKYFYELDDAFWIRTSKFGDDKDRVLKKGNGALTYMVADVANHIEKYNRGFDLMINLWGSDHHGYEKRIKASLDILGFDSKKLNVDYISMVKIANKGEEVKMSKRKGNALQINELLKIIDKNILRFNIISKGKEQSLIIDIDDINKKNMNNPYWYVQYVNARISKLIKRGEGAKKVTNFSKIFELNDEKEMNLIRKMLDFDQIILSAYKNREPNVLLNYLRELANLFHSYYSSCKIFNDDKNSDEKLFFERMQLIIIFNTIYKKIFMILGIDALESM